MKFRYDINGLRAIAVLIVLFFHLGITGFSGGYIGVDIFFVISGFLMTGIISSKLDVGNFSFLDFYAARAKRIIPALVVLVIALLILGFFYLIPFEYKLLSNISLSSLGFYSNNFFAGEDGYFDITSQNNWLLHTWSLSVEWRFYLLFPILLMWLKKLKQGIYFNKGLIATFILSLLLSIVLTKFEPTTAFFILPTRVWEFLAGGFVFLHADKIPKFRYRFWVGLLLVAISAFIYTDELNFPSYWAILPVLGAVLVIAENSDSIVIRNRFIQYVGKISYSLYLWHWPIVVAIKYLEIEVTMMHTMAALALAFILAHISYTFVEQVFRNVKKDITSLKIIWINVVVILCVGAFAGTILYKKGLKFRVSDAVIAAETVERNKIYYIKGCDFNYKKQGGVPHCKIGSEGVKPTVAIWGDSHASSAAQGMVEVLVSNNKAAYLYSYAGCPSVLGIMFSGSSRSKKCNSINERTYDAVSADKNIDSVMLISRWPVYSHGYNENNGPHLYATFRDDIGISEENLDERVKDYTDNIVRTACNLRAQGKKVYLFTTVPEMVKNVSLTLAKYKLLRTKDKDISVSVANYDRRNDAILKGFNKAKTKCGAKVMDVKPYFCEGDKCSGIKDGKSLYADDDHLNIFGNKHIQKIYEAAIK